MRHFTGFLFILLSVFFISSCHHVGKNKSYDKKQGEKQHQQQKETKKKDCCAKKKSEYKDKKASCSSKKSKKDYCGKKYKKRSFFKWSKKYKKDCCGKADFAGFSSVKPVAKGKLSGSVYFESAGRYEVKVTADFKGLAPNSEFAFHVHEFGNCENKGLLAGGHLNPWGSKHAGPQSKDRHMGDLGNLKSDKSGKALYSTVIKGKLSKFLGRSIIVHAKADDMKSQPSGNSGKRIACGIIVASMPPVPPVEEEATAEKKKAPAVEKATTSKKKAPAVEKATTSNTSKKKAPAVEKATTSNTSKKKAPVVEKATTSNTSKKKAPAVEKATTSKKKAPAVEKAVSKQKAEMQKASDISSDKAKNSKK